MAPLVESLLHVLLVVFLVLKQILQLGEDVLALVIGDRSLRLSERFGLLPQPLVHLQRL